MINGYPVEESTDEDTGLTTYTYFACVCEDVDEQFWKQALDEYPSSEYVVSTLIMDLTHNYSAYVRGISADMWFGISISAGYGSWDETKENFVYEKECELFIQCDLVEHGLLAATMILKELGYGEEK